MDKDNEQTAASRTRIAEDRFNELITQLESNSKASSVSIEAVADALDRFKLWAGNIGARQSATSLASLESRLAAAQRVLEQVGDLLDELTQALNDLLEIASGSRENRRITYENLIDDNDFSSSEHQLEDEASSNVEKDEFQDIFDVILECIRSLFRISILIRKATPRDRYAKALQVGDPFIDQFDINYVAEKYPKLNQPGSAWLCARLGRAITKRREFLCYSREHGIRIASPYRNDVDVSSNLQMDSLVRAPTKASTLEPATLQRIEKDEANTEDTESFNSASPSLQMGSENSRLHLPKLADLSSRNSPFECPFCLGIQAFTRQSAWRRHAYGDLKAYVCTLGKGRCDSEMFGDRRTWFDHEVQCHRKQWMCVLCSKERFTTPADFKTHAKNKHANVLFNDRQLELFMDASQRAVDAIAADECPFCDEWEATLRNNTLALSSTEAAGSVIRVEPIRFSRHVASHMEQLALFAIPRSTGDDKSEEGTNVKLSRSTVSAALQSLVPRDSETDDEWVPDPPLHIAAASGDLATFRALLEDGADIHLRGETWGTALAAALSCHQSTRDDILNILRNLSERPSEPLSEPPRERLGPTPSPSPSPEPPGPDNDVYDTTDTYACSECGYEGPFEYEANEEDACCKMCYHVICSSCTKKDNPSGEIHSPSDEIYGSSDEIHSLSDEIQNWSS